MIGLSPLDETKIVLKCREYGFIKSTICGSFNKRSIICGKDGSGIDIKVSIGEDVDCARAIVYYVTGKMYVIKSPSFKLDDRSTFEEYYKSVSSMKKLITEQCTQ